MYGKSRTAADLKKHNKNLIQKLIKEEGIYYKAGIVAFNPFKSSYGK